MNENGANFFNKWWKVLTAVLALVVAFTTLQINVGANSKTLNDIQLDLNGRQVRITTNEVNIQEIKDDISEIKIGQKEILKELRK